MINGLVTRVEVSRSTITVQLIRNNLIRLLTAGSPVEAANQKRNLKTIELKAEVKLQRSGIESKLVYPAGKQPQTHDRSVKALQEALLKSLQWNEQLVSGSVRSIDALIDRDNLNARQVHRLRKLAFLAPDIMDRIIAGDVLRNAHPGAPEKGFPYRLGSPTDPLRAEPPPPLVTGEIGVRENWRFQTWQPVSQSLLR